MRSGFGSSLAVLAVSVTAVPFPQYYNGPGPGPRGGNDYYYGPGPRGPDYYYGPPRGPYASPSPVPYYGPLYGPTSATTVSNGIGQMANGLGQIIGGIAAAPGNIAGGVWNGLTNHWRGTGEENAKAASGGGRNSTEGQHQGQGGADLTLPVSPFVEDEPVSAEMLGLIEHE